MLSLKSPQAEMRMPGARCSVLAAENGLGAQSWLSELTERNSKQMFLGAPVCGFKVSSVLRAPFMISLLSQGPR